MTNLKLKLAKAREFDDEASSIASNECSDKSHRCAWSWEFGARYQHAKDEPLFLALVECVDAMIEASEYSRRDDVNGQAGELCKDALAKLEAVLDGNSHE